MVAGAGGLSWNKELKLELELGGGGAGARSWS